MRLKRSGTIRRVDLEELFGLVLPLHEEWRSLCFDDSGAVVNPLTQSLQPAFVLSSGRHRRAGATYVVTSEHPIVEIPEEHRERLDAELVALRANDASHAEMTAHRLERAELSVEVGTDRTTTLWTLLADDPRGLTFDVLDPDHLWTAEVSVDRDATPRVTGEWNADLSAMLRRETTKGGGCLVWLLGGKARIEGFVDTAPLKDVGGPVLRMNGRANRFRLRGRVDVVPEREVWEVRVDARLRARGLGRLVLLFGRRRIQQGFDRGCAAVFGVTDDAEPAEALKQLATDIEEAGGPEQAVHRMLWDVDFP